MLLFDVVGWMVFVWVSFVLLSSLVLAIKCWHKAQKCAACSFGHIQTHTHTCCSKARTQWMQRAVCRWWNRELCWGDFFLSATVRTAHFRAAENTLELVLFLCGAGAMCSMCAVLIVVILQGTHTPATKAQNGMKKIQIDQRKGKPTAQRRDRSDCMLLNAVNVANKCRRHTEFERERAQKNRQTFDVSRISCGLICEWRPAANNGQEESETTYTGLYGVSE